VHQIPSRWLLNLVVMDSLSVEKGIHRSNGDPRFDALIRFTQTVINPPIDPSLFSIAKPSPH